MPSLTLESLNRRQAREERATRAMRQRFAAFFHAYLPRRPYHYGRHTWAIINEVQAAVEAVEAGGSYFSVINVPPRHGKSDVASRRAPAWVLTRNPDYEVILASYSAKLSKDLSRSARGAFVRASEWSGLDMDPSQAALDAWGVAEHGGVVYAVGLGGTINGRGAHFMTIDDYLQNREEAESLLIREKIWDSFVNDLMTRLAPNCAVLIPSTRWHHDDLVGRIINRNDPKHKQYNPDFPKFKIVKCPAQGSDGAWLAPERFPVEHYLRAKSFGPYVWNSLFQQEPTPRHGNRFKVEAITDIVAPDAVPNNLLWRRGWDLASSDRERTRENPSATVGIKSAWDGENVWIADMVRGQWEAPERDRQIFATAVRDGPDVAQVLEVVAGYKDTFTRFEELLWGHSVVDSVTPDKDKTSRAAFLEPLVEAGKVKLVRGAWNEEFIGYLAAFPGSDESLDVVDALVVSTHGVVTIHVPSFGIL